MIPHKNREIEEDIVVHIEGESRRVPIKQFR